MRNPASVAQSLQDQVRAAEQGEMESIAKNKAHKDTERNHFQSFRQVASLDCLVRHKIRNLINWHGKHYKPLRVYMWSSAVDQQSASQVLNISIIAS